MAESEGYKEHILQLGYKIVGIAVVLALVFHLVIENSSLFYRSSFTLPFSLHLNNQDITMIQGEETHLSVFGINKRVSFYSTNFRVADVNFNGRVYAYHTGKTFIVAKVDGKKLKCRVRVIAISKKRIELKKGQKFRLKIEGTWSSIQWKSSNQAVAEVSALGKVVAKSRGTTVITAKVRGRTLKCSCYVRP